MPQLVGNIQDSMGNGVSGDLIIDLDAQLIDTSTTPDRVLYGKPVKYEVVNGSLASCRRYNDDNTLNAAAAINIANSGSITYTFAFKVKRSVQEFYLDGGQYLGDRVQITSGTNPPVGWYTGAVYNATTSRALQTYTRQVEQDLFVPFSASINDPTTTEWASLQSTGVNIDNLDTSIKEIARYAASNYGSSIASSIFVPSGDYNAATIYPKFATVYDTANRRLCWKITNTLTAGLSLPNVGQASNTNWMVILEAPTQVSQTITLLDAADLIGAHNGNLTQAFTVNAIYDILQFYARAANTISSGAVDTKISNALSGFTAPPATTANDQPPDTANTSIANTKFVKSALNNWITLEHRVSMGSNGGSAPGNYNNRLINTRVAGQAVNANAGNTGVTDTICTALNASTGEFTIRAGRYRVSAWASASRVDNHRMYLFNVTANADTNIVGSSEFSGSNLVSNAAGSSQSRVQYQELNLAANSVLQMRHYVSNPTSGTDALGRASNAITSESFAGITFERLN